MWSVQTIGDDERRVVHLLDTDASSRASIAAGMGFNGYSFTTVVAGRRVELLYADPQFPSGSLKPSHHGTPLLAPFPNRIRGGRFPYQGHDFQLPRNERDINAIHGLVIGAPWRVVDQGTSRELGAWVRGEFRLSTDRPESLPLWPSDFEIAVVYALKGETLRTDIEIANVGDQVCPMGFGTHPYFRFPMGSDGRLDDCVIQSPLSQQVELVECLPTGKIMPVDQATDLRSPTVLGGRTLDNVFTGVIASPDGRVNHSLIDPKSRTRLTLSHDPQFGFVVLFTPPHRQAICIEPYTCVTDAVNLDKAGMATGLWHLEPGKRRHLWIEYHASELT